MDYPYLMIFLFTLLILGIDLHCDSRPSPYASGIGAWGRDELTEHLEPKAIGTMSWKEREGAQV